MYIYQKMVICAVLPTVFLIACGRQSHTPVSSQVAPNSNTQVEDELLQQQLVGADIRDIQKFKSKEIPQVDVLIQDMLARPNLYFPVGVTFSTNGVGVKFSSRVNAVYGVEMQSTILKNADQTQDMIISAFIHEQKEGYFFRKMTVRFDMQKKQVVDIKFLTDVPLNQAKFVMRVGLIQRKLVLEDKENGIKKVYPLGVGGFDLGVRQKGVVTLMTPLINNSEANINQKFVLASRLKPTYFEGRPFIRIFRQNNDMASTPYAFHGKIDAVLTRGFVSHGCMRMQDKDVFELMSITKYGSQAFVPVSVSMLSIDKIEHPFPLTNNRYNSVINFGSSDKPRSAKDQEGLTAMKTMRDKAPIDLLIESLKTIEPTAQVALNQSPQ